MTTQGAGAPWPCYMCPISIMGTDSGSPGDDYFDPADPTHEEILKRYGGDGTARLILGLDTEHEPPQEPVAPECIAYDSIDRQTAAPQILFVRDRDPYLNNLRQHMKMATSGCR